MVDADPTASPPVRADDAAHGAHGQMETETTTSYPTHEGAQAPAYAGQGAGNAASTELAPSANAASVARAATAADRNVLYIPLAVSIGDGFKFGCGFFLASVLAMLVGFVLLAVLFVLTSLFGLNVPLGR